MFTVKWIVNAPHGEMIRIFEAKEIAVAYRDKMGSVALPIPTRQGYDGGCGGDAA